jgi:type IV secretory pathway VirB3-like protein
VLPVLQASTVPEFRSIARPRTVLGLPPGYAVLLLMAAAIQALVLGYVWSAVVLVVTLWGLGAWVTWYDPYAWTLFARMNRVPRLLRP